MINDLQEKMEREVLMLLLREKPAFLDQLSTASVTKREFTGVGVYTHYHVNGIVSFEEDLHISGVGAKINNNIQIGFLLFIKKGRLDFLECYTYDDPWPNVIECYEVFTH